MKGASAIELTMIHANLSQRLEIVKQYLPRETDPDKREERVRYIAAMETRIAEIKKIIGG